MVKLFETYVIKKVTVTPPAPSGDAVQSERLQYDNRNTGKKAVNPNTAAVVVAETSRMATEAVAAAVLGQDVVANRKAVEDISNTVTATAGEVGRRQADLIETVIIPLVDVSKKVSAQTDSITINFGKIQTPIRGGANAVVSNTNFTNPNNAIDDNLSTSANLTATASGIGGLTSVTTSGQLTLGFPDPAFPDIPLGSATVLLFFGMFHATAGTLPLGQSWNSQLQVSVNNGASFTTVFTHTGSGNKDFTADITGLVAGSYANINGLQARISSTVVSGTGLGASASCQWFSSILLFTVSKTY